MGNRNIHKFENPPPPPKLPPKKPIKDIDVGENHLIFAIFTIAFFVAILCVIEAYLRHFLTP